MKIPERLPIQKNGIFTNFALTPEPKETKEPEESQEPEPSGTPKGFRRYVPILNLISLDACLIIWF